MSLLLALAPVLLVHGIDDTRAVFARMQPALAAGGRVVEAIDMVPAKGDVSLAVLGAQIAARATELLRRTGAARLDLVAFSLGGIASRHYLQRQRGVEQVGHFVTISSPHQGTLTGFLRNNPGATELRPGSVFLADLNRDWETTARRLSVTSIWTPLDLMIVPAPSSRLPLAREVTIPVALHPWMLGDERVISAVRTALDLPLP